MPKLTPVDSEGDQPRYLTVLAADMATFENQDPDKAIESICTGIPIDMNAAIERHKHWHDQLEYARKHPIKVRILMAWQTIRRLLRIA